MTEAPGSRRMALDEVRAALASDLSPRDEAQWLRVLAGDPRRGARVLAERLERRRDARRREGQRVSRLFARRRALFRAGARHVAGVDEVGVGPLAGPVVAAAVVLEERVSLPGLDDSKRLSRDEREDLDRRIRAQAIAVSVSEVGPAEIDRRNILQATLVAMRRAVAGLAVEPDHLLVDARTVPDVAIPQTPLIKGDARDGSIAAASIVAKVYRDARMRELEERFPGYGFAQHKGYGTAAHIAALAELGASPVHRRSFAPVTSAGARS